ncbi:hypothetical protein I0D68_18295 [Pseudomonas lalucatii]|nr:hypothetical protein I0D68_18295 [Pseudomonas lalucatii]
MDQVVADLSVAADQAGLQGAQAAVLPQGVQELLAVRRVQPEAQGQGAAAHGLGPAPAELAFEAGIDLDEAPAGLLGDHHAVRGVVEGPGELLLAGAAGRARAVLPLGADHANDARRISGAVIVPVRAAADLQPVQAAVRPASTMAHGLRLSGVVLQLLE